MASIRIPSVSRKKRIFVDSSVLMATAISPIVAGAVTSKADYLVSFDQKHLLQNKKEIEQNFKVKVISPGELIK